MAMTSSGTATVTLPTDEQILIRREFDAPRHLVYRAWTTPELVRRWWGAKRGEVTLAEIDLRVDEILRVLAANVDLARRTIASVATALPDRAECRCARALEHAIITARETIPTSVKRDLEPIVGRYL